MPNDPSTPGPSPRAGEEQQDSVSIPLADSWFVRTTHGDWFLAAGEGIGFVALADLTEDEMVRTLHRALSEIFRLRAAAQGGEGLDTQRLDWMQEVDPVIECRVSKSSEKRWEVWSVDSYEGSSLRAAIDRAMSAANAVSGRSPDHGEGGGER